MKAALDPLVCAQALEANAAAYAIAMAEATGGQVLRQEDALITILPFDHPLNSARLVRFSSSAARQRIGEILELFLQRRVGVRFRLGPASPPGLERFFERPRFVRVTQAHLACRLAEMTTNWPAPPGVRVVPVEDYRVFAESPHPRFGLVRTAAKRRIMAGMQKLADERPRRHWTFVAEKEGQFVASVVVFLHEDSVSGSEFCVRKEFQRQGVGTAVLQEVWALARERGVGLAVLVSSGMGGKFYPRFGFQPVRPYPFFHCSKERLLRYGADEAT